MRTIEIQLFKFSELSEEAKQKALETLYDINVDYNWWEMTYDDAKEIGLKLEYFGLDRNLHATGELMLSAVEVAQNIINSHGETCDTHKVASEFLESHNPVFAEYFQTESSELEEKLMNIESEFTKDLLSCYAQMLQNESEYLTSEEAIIETIESNDYEFTADGKLH